MSIYWLVDGILHIVNNQLIALLNWLNDFYADDDDNNIYIVMWLTLKKSVSFNQINLDQQS